MEQGRVWNKNMIKQGTVWNKEQGRVWIKEHN
jgi:hypothetical protein